MLPCRRLLVRVPAMSSGIVGRRMLGRCAYTSCIRFFSFSPLALCSASPPATPQHVPSAIDSGTDAQNASGEDNTVRDEGASASQVLQYPYEVVDTPEKLRTTVQSLSASKSIGLDIEAFCTAVDSSSMQLGSISLVQACGDACPIVFIFDVLTLTIPVFVAAMRPIMENAMITKFFFDCRRDVEALSTQMQLTPRGVIDLQLYYTALQWRLRSVNRRSGMTYALKSVAGVDRAEGDSAVQAAMTLGNRPVWDVRPLPPHFLEYAADDVRHIVLLQRHLLAEEKSLSATAGGVGSETSSNGTISTSTPAKLSKNIDKVELLGAVARLSTAYVEHYAVGHPVATEADLKPAEVNVHWLENYIGPGGVCNFCGSRGHTEAECFKKQHGSGVRCAFCGAQGHTSRNCFKRFPQLLKCEMCGQVGHVATSCFRKNPCKYCGGFHSSANCHRNKGNMNCV